MHNMLTTLSLIAMIGAAVLSFMNKDNLAKAKEDQIAKEKSREVATADLADSKDTLAGLQSDISTATGESETFAQEAEKLATEIQTKEDELENLESELDTTKEERDRQKEELAKVGDIEAAVKRLEEVKAENAVLSARVSSLNGSVTSLTSSSESLQSEIDSISQRIKDSDEGRVPQNFSATIAQVYPQWGFVVLAAGNEQRAAEGATLAVIRAGVEVAQVKITDLLQTRAVADVLPGKTAEGVTLQPGDRVYPIAQAQ